MSDEKQNEFERDRSYAGWLAFGARKIISIPALILMVSFIGFGGLAAEAGLTVFETMFLSFTTWALPSAVVVAGAIFKEVPFYSAVIAVVLASVRLMPMTMALVPIMRSKETKTWQLVMASNFVAVTAWVFAMQHLPKMPREGRLPFFVGFGGSLAIINTGISGLANAFATALPPLAAAALLFLTPIYFLISMTNASKVPSEYFAIGLGLVLGPVFHLIAPDVDLLLCGIVGGTIAYGMGRFTRMNEPL